MCIRDRPCVTSDVVESVEAAVEFAGRIGYPVIVRPAYTLGGSGGGIAYDEPSLREIADRGIHLSRVGQVLIERCIFGWKEIEFEVMRDSAGNVIQICSMENIDPVGVHTGDSIVVAPTQTPVSYTHLVDSRPSDEGASIRRRRECLECHKRFTTYETMESLPLVVIKKDGSRQTCLLYTSPYD